MELKARSCIDLYILQKQNKSRKRNITIFHLQPLVLGTSLRYVITGFPFYDTAKMVSKHCELHWIALVFLLALSELVPFRSTTWTKRWKMVVPPMGMEALLGLRPAKIWFEVHMSTLRALRKYEPSLPTYSEASLSSYICHYS